MGSKQENHLSLRGTLSRMAEAGALSAIEQVPVIGIVLAPLVELLLTDSSRQMREQLAQWAVERHDKDLRIGPRQLGLAGIHANLDKLFEESPASENSLTGLNGVYSVVHDGKLISWWSSQMGEDLKLENSANFDKKLKGEQSILNLRVASDWERKTVSVDVSDEVELLVPKAGSQVSTLKIVEERPDLPFGKALKMTTATIAEGSFENDNNPAPMPVFRWDDVLDFVSNAIGHERMKPLK